MTATLNMLATFAAGISTGQVISTALSGSWPFVEIVLLILSGIAFWSTWR